MSWIREVSRKDNKKLNKIYTKAEKRTSQGVANVLRVHSINPDVLEIHMNLYEQIMFGSSELSRTDREMIGVVVSVSNECPYCITHHREALNFVSKGNELMQKVANDYREASLTKKQLVICQYVEKLTKTPYKIVQEDIFKLRDTGFSDEAIFDINQICAYFNYVNRIVHGLGVDLENPPL